MLLFVTPTGGGRWVDRPHRPVPYRSLTGVWAWVCGISVNGQLSVTSANECRTARVVRQHLPYVRQLTAATL